eukprot:CAMPEP_0184297034 /NCGR_PEP_ID=MMETSP1049-20130417/7966_1 /TAXON_ID=77928 /ORGANISM="Proteomonas sulcata, Strain CCMP704" /LENGTH=106 /DNA_ID=CAMNT_0026606563 /DNA_START=125 /DNA_END=445 /DNA_ORIENTATION=+
MVNEKLTGQRRKYSGGHNIVINLVFTFTALAVQSLSMAICVLIGLVDNSIVWSNVLYVKQQGKVKQVWRRNKQGKLYTEPWKTSLQKAINRRKHRLQLTVDPENLN